MDEERKDEVYLAALAGLLHDVGKVGQRAGERGSADRETAKRDFGHYHALLTYDVIPKLTAALDNDIGVIVRHAAGYHHRPQNDMGALVQLADHLSAGERDEDEDNRVPYLESIFARIGGGEPQAKKSYLPLAALDPTREIIFPHERALQWTDAHEREYGKLWRTLCRDAQTLPGDSLPVYLESLLDLLQRYTWCVPSAYYRSVPDVSLYDHSRMTAALAACLAADKRETAWCEARKDEFWSDKAGEPVALLVAGDISGVQKFLYSIASEDAAKSLRGRSVYLQLLTEAVAHYLLDQLGLPSTNLLYAGGGNFYLIAPVTARDALPMLQAGVTEKLLTAHEGNLRLASAWIPVQAREFKIGAFEKVWERLHEPLLRRAKEQPLVELPADDFAANIGIGYGKGGSVKSCPVCGREEEKLHDDGVCSLCDSFAELGRQVARATHLVVRLGTPSPARRITAWHQGLEQFGVNIWLVNADAPPEQGQYLRGGSRDVNYMRLYALPGTEPARYANRLETEIQARFPGAMARLFRPFAQLVPYNKTGAIKTFDQLAKDSTGIPRWGVLRMDVDNLGDLFRKGFKRQVDGEEKDCLTLSRVATLSFALRLFFEGYLPTLGKPWEDKLYLQYAGGDDLFVVGAWDVLPGFALAVQQSFNEYVCANPGVTLSGGISLHPEKFPLYRAAEEAGAAESRAKGKRQREEQGKIVTEAKNALCFLDTPLAWDELEQVKAQAEKLREWVEKDKVSKALLQNLLRLHNEWQVGRDAAVKKGQLARGKFFYGPWVWHAVYQLNRIDCKDDAIRNEIRSWPKQILCDQNLVVRLGVAARWAALWTRKQSESGGKA